MRRATNCTSIGRPKRLYFYPRSPCGERRVHYDNYNLHCVISIHALLAESDRTAIPNFGGYVRNFYPRSPCGERRAPRYTPAAGRNFYPRSPCGERLPMLSTVVILILFLSTLSLRRATHYDNYNLHCVEISIHALLAESD